MDLLELLESPAPESKATPSYAVELLFAGAVDLEARQAKLEESLRDHGLELEAGSSLPWSWHLPGISLQAQLLPGSIDRQRFQASCQQSWWWPEGEAALATCTHALRLTDQCEAGVSYKKRLEVFQRSLVALLQVHPCRVLHWLPTQQLVNPGEAMDSYTAHHFATPLPGAINVRFFRLPQEGNRAEELLMDTLGLGTLGLSDLQCHFRGLDPNDVSEVLYETALYVFDRGDVLEDGHTVKGPAENDRWRCQRELSIAMPKRDVVDLDPGFPFAGGVPLEADAAAEGERPNDERRR